MNSKNSTLTPFRVMLREIVGNKFQIAFECQAEDADHAVEQAEDAYPGCEIVSFARFEDKPLVYVIYSPNESAISGGAGFWSNEDGWTELEGATQFTHAEKRSMHLPIAAGADAVWMLHEGVDQRGKAAGEAVQAAPSSVDLDAALSALKSRGLKFADCISAFATHAGDPYVEYVRNVVQTEERGVDDKVVIAPGEDGAFVMMWQWVSDREAGLLKHADLLEAMLECAQKTLDAHDGTDEDVRSLREGQAQWLEELITNFADELDGIEHEVIKRAPAAIDWTTAEGVRLHFMPSDAINQLRLLARRGGLSDSLSDQVDRFSIRFGNKLDAVLAALELQP